MGDHFIRGGAIIENDYIARFDKAGGMPCDHLFFDVHGGACRQKTVFIFNILI